jgi:proteasome accessory factor C
MRRVLAVVPWIVANPGRRVTEVAERFGLTEAELLADLNVVFLVGLPPYSPDALVDVEIDDEGRVFIRLADFFSRPLRLTPEQGLALLASSDALLSIPGTDPAGALARALDKLGSALGFGPDDALDVHLGSADGSVLDQLQEAVTNPVEVELTYYSYGRDERSTRVVDPWRVFAEGGAWYLQGWCQRARGERVFRVDRIEDLTVTDRLSRHRPPAGASGGGVFQPGPDDPRVVLRLAPEAAWVADAYPVTVLERHPDGRQDVEVVVTAVPWLERLLIRVGPGLEIIGRDGLEEAEQLASRAASRILARYRSSARPRRGNT